MAQQHYTGSCQCGAIAFQADADLDHAITCNCSRCRRLGAVLVVVPAPAFVLTRDGPITEYMFGHHSISHRFCPTCGIQPYALGEQDGRPIVAINCNCLDGVDARALDSQAVDGASF
ncbi:MAG TPA: GFA family protein [Paracoccus sp. (in: a-proteobacteria)]|nr:GFA family protein [Paracoccus sp. (in: a-proteobacteria)]